MRSELFFRTLPKEINLKISKYSLNVYFLCLGNQLTKRDMKDIFEYYDYSKEDYFDIIEYSLIPTLLYFNKYSFYEDLNLNWSVNDTVLAYYAIKYKRYSVINKPLFVDKLFLEGFLKNHSEAISAIGHHLYYIPENNCQDFFRMYHRKGQAVFRPSKYSIQFKNKEVYYDMLRDLLPDYPAYEKFIYGSQALLDHLNRVLNIEKIVNHAEEKNCSLRSPYSSPPEHRKNYNKQGEGSSHCRCSSGSSSGSTTNGSDCGSGSGSSEYQEINKFYPYLYDYLFLLNSSDEVSQEKIFNLTMNSWNCSLVSVILLDVFQPRIYDGRHIRNQSLEYQKCLMNAKRMVNAYSLEDDLLQYRLMMDQNYLSLERLFDVYAKILEYDTHYFYRIDHLFHIFFPTIVLLVMNQDVKRLKAYTSLLTYKHWIEHVVVLFDYAIEFYQYKLDKFPNQIEKIKRKYSVEVKHYKTVLNKYLEGH